MNQTIDAWSFTALMDAPAPVTSKGLCKAFTTTFLLTGNARQAETAILDAIRGTEAEGMSDDRLFLEAVVAAVRPKPTPIPRTDELDRASLRLPPQLRRVLHLSFELRQCFVLRILLGWSREDCSHVLRLNVRRVDEGAYTAARELARISEEEKAA